MGKLILTALLLIFFPTVVPVQVYVQDSTRSVTMFAPVTLRCDYSTSANPQYVVVTWYYRSFCLDPVLNYYSAAYQAELSLGKNPADDCPDSQRTVRTVAQKSGTNEPILGPEYQGRKITIQNKADLAITEVMWWDNGMYYCSVVATGDPTGGLDGKVMLIVYNWLVVIFIVMGGLLLILLIGICWCQCCPQHCCCYVRCPCCPQTCCCPEKVVMQHRMIKDAQKAMTPWMYGQPVYAPLSTASSMRTNPIYYSDPSKQNIPMGALPLPPPPSVYNNMPSSIPGKGSMQGANMALDYLENQVRSMDMNSPVPLQQPLPLQHMPLQMAPPPQHMTHQQIPPPMHMPQSVPFSAGPPSMLSSLNEMGVQGMERRVIQLPPIMERAHGSSQRSGSRGPRPASRASSSSNYSGYRRGDNLSRLGSSPLRRGILRIYSDESEVDERHRRPGSGRHSRSRSRDDLMDEARRAPVRRDRSYSPPHRRGSWSSEDEASERPGRGRGDAWPEKPPSYSSIDMMLNRKLNGGHKNGRYSDKSSRSGTSVVI